jgi:IS30 family transposase
MDVTAATEAVRQYDGRQKTDQLTKTGYLQSLISENLDADYRAQQITGQKKLAHVKHSTKKKCYAFSDPSCHCYLPF